MTTTETTWTPVLEVFVSGTPAPQGSKDARAIYRGSGENREFTGKIVVTERYGGGSKNPVKVWRRAVALVVSSAVTGDPADGPIRMTLQFVMPRPKSTPKRTTPPAIRRPDVDKLSRSTLDAVQTGGAYTDDARVVDLRASTRLAEIGETPGAHIRIEVPA